MCKKTRRPHTVIVYLSNVKFNCFIYSARKTVRQVNETSETSTLDLFVSDNLTPFNYKLYKELKLEGDRLSLECSPNYESVYSFEGKIYVKKRRVDPNTDSVHIKTIALPRSFILSLAHTAEA